VALQKQALKQRLYPHINGIAVNTGDVQGQIARFQPGDNVSLMYNRGAVHNTGELTNLTAQPIFLRRLFLQNCLALHSAHSAAARRNNTVWNAGGSYRSRQWQHGSQTQMRKAL